VLRHGLRAVTQAIAEGQYEFPRGLFFGGSKLESGPALYLDWLRDNLPRAEYGRTEASLTLRRVWQ